MLILAYYIVYFPDAHSKTSNVLCAGRTGIEFAVMSIMYHVTLCL